MTLLWRLNASTATSAALFCVGSAEMKRLLLSDENAHFTCTFFRFLLSGNFGEGSVDRKFGYFYSVVATRTYCCVVVVLVGYSYHCNINKLEPHYYFIIVIYQIYLVDYPLSNLLIMSVFLKSRLLLRTAPKLGCRGLVTSTVAAQSSEAYNNTPKLSWVYQGQGHGSQSHAYSRLLAAATVAAAGLLFAGVQQADNCGIIGVVGGTDDASKYLLEGLTIMRNRGYDSAGLATINPSGKDMLFTKYASVETTSDSIDKVAVHAASHAGNHIGIAHTRWATHGGKTDENAHPHTDAGNRVAVVHNGTINNAFELKKELTALGIEFSSQTDTEIIAQLVGLYLDKGMNTKDAVTAALERCVHVVSS